MLAYMRMIFCFLTQSIKPQKKKKKSLTFILI